MYLFELFENGSMTDILRKQIMDYLTPLAASQVEFIPIQDLMSVLQDSKTGLMIDRGLIMRLIEPDINKLVKEVNGDKVYLSVPVDEISAKSEDDAEKDKQKIADKASKEAKKAVNER